MTLYLTRNRVLSQFALRKFPAPGVYKKCRNRRRVLGTVPLRIALRIALLFPLASCGLSQPPPAVRSVPIQQTWQMQPGSAIADHRVLAGLGDISIELAGDRVYAPFDGQIQPTAGDCVVFSSPEVPAYLLRLCGLRRPSLGRVQEGQPLGRGEVLHFATLRKQSDGRWALVEPSAALLTRLLRSPVASRP